MNPDVKKALAIDLLSVAEEWTEASEAVARTQEALKQAESRERAMRERFRTRVAAALDAAEKGALPLPEVARG